MSKEKQIAEMAEDLKGRDPCKHLPRELCDNRTCLLCEAEILYEAGYRKQEWISVNDMMPEDMYGEYRKKITVLVCTESGRVSTASRRRVFCFDQTKKKWLELDTFEWSNRKRVVHWMPLPDAPKGE